MNAIEHEKLLKQIATLYVKHTEIEDFFNLISKNFPIPHLREYFHHGGFNGCLFEAIEANIKANMDIISNMVVKAHSSAYNKSLMEHFLEKYKEKEKRK